MELFITLIKRISIPGFSEPMSSMTHLFIIPVFAVLMGLLIKKAWGKTPLYLHIIYAVSVIVLFAMSGVFHLLDQEGEAKGILQRLDHAAIFLITAGTFVPIHGILFKGFARWGILAIVWAAAITGIIVKSIWFEEISEGLGLVFYLSLGWMGLWSGILLVRHYGWRFIGWMVLGGAAYTIGAMMDFGRWPVVVEGVFQAHEVFHLFVILGALFHWRFIYGIAAGVQKEKLAQGLTA